MGYQLVFAMTMEKKRMDKNVAISTDIFIFFTLFRQFNLVFNVISHHRGRQTYHRSI